MNRYSLGEVKKTTPEIDLGYEAFSIAVDVAVAEACYEQLVEADRACDEVYAVLENLQTISDTLKECFYSPESIETLNNDKSLTKITGYATESITPQIAEEAIKDNLAKAWEALKNFISKIIDTIGNFFAKLFNMASAQAQKIIDTKAASIDFSAEKETITVDQYKNLRAACEGLNAFVQKHVDVKNYFVVSSVAVQSDSATDNSSSGLAEGLNKDISTFVAKSNNILKAEDGKVTIMDEALKKEKKVLSTAGWTTSGAIEIAQYFLDNKSKSSRLGELMKRLKGLNVTANMAIGGFSVAKMACRAETSAYACYAKCLRAFGKQIKCLNGAHKAASK